MKPVLGISLGTALVLGIIAIPGITSLDAQPNQSAIARFTKIQGDVQVKSYSQGSTWRFATPSTALRYGDLLRVSPNANAEIECMNNSSIRRIVPNDNIPWGVASACPPSQRLYKR